MKSFKRSWRAVAGLALLLALFLLTACQSQVQPEASPTPIPSPTASPSPTPEPMPALPDIDIESWEYILANSYNSIHVYEPMYGGIGGQGIDSRIVDAVSELLQGARDAGYQAYVAVAYRNFEYLLNHYIYEINDQGSAAEAAAIRLPPGCNEHQTGLAIDMTDNYEYNATFLHQFTNEGFEDSELYQWLLEHCQEYGFILRYPEGKEDYYGTACCPGHFRYVGKEAAEYIMENDLCLEEFLLLYDENAVYLPEKAA